ncbi:MAG: Crp/Fnr family transcriptional regulator [Chitinophagales bacterium]
MNDKTDYWYLENVDLHALFCPIALSELEDPPEPKIYKKGEFIYFPDDKTTKVYFVEVGRVKIGSYSVDGKEVIKAILHTGEVFGELGLVGQRTYNEFSQAMEKTQLCVMGIDEMRGLMRQNKDFSLQVTQIIGNKLVRTQRRLESLIFKDARSRIIEFLRDLAVQKGQRVGYEMVVRQFFTHQEIANLTGTSRQTVTTILNELRADNMIYFDRRKLLVRDLEKLSALIQ